MIRALWKFRLTAIVALAGWLSDVAAAQAGEVTLRMKNGDFQIKGDLVAYDKSKYTIMSKSLGSMSLDATRFECLGPGCPDGALAIKTPETAPATETAAITGPSHITVSGSNTIGNQLMPALVEAYAASTANKVTKVVGADPLDLEFRMTAAGGAESGVIAVHRHGSATAFTEIENKTAQIGMSSRPAKTDEAQKLNAAGFGDIRQPGSEHVLGLDGLMVLVAPDNPVVSLSLDAIAKIFSGQITDWSQIGQPAGKINVYAPTKESGTFDTFENLVLKPNKLELVASAKRTANHSEQSDWVAHDPLGIGFAGVAYQRNAKAVNLESSCGLISAPYVFNMKTEEYPLSRRLFLYTPGEPRDPMAHGLLTFALSPQAQSIVKKFDFIDQTPDRTNYDSQAGRIAYALNAAPENFDAGLMKSFTNDIKQGERLSVTFRFQLASHALDNKALADAKRLVELLKTEGFRQKTVLLAGFADTVGLFPVNTLLSQNRARAVLAALKANGLATPTNKVVIRGYGELAPVACNDTPDNMSLNRRVEVWVY